ncbi:MAG: hypothetical protein AAGK32_19555, partial [Actinomycetota bacterium]
ALAGELVGRQGHRTPWRNHQSYLADYRAMKLRSVVDEGLELSNPGPPGRAEPAGADRVRAA